MYPVTCTHIQGQPMSLKTCIFLIVALKETLVLMWLASHFVITESWKINILYCVTCNKRKC